jgi:hypothetical protein
MVSGHRPGDLPDDPTEPRLHRRTITLELSPESYDIWRKLHALAAEEHGQRLSDDELIPALFRRAYGTGPAGAAAPAATSSSNAACSSTTTSTDVAYHAGSIAAVSTSSIAAGFPDEVGAVGAAGAGNISGASASGAPAVFSMSGSPAYQIAIKRCPDCNRGWQYTGGRDIEVDPAVLELAACDAVHLGSLDAAAPERTTTTVTPRKRQQVLARDGRCCTVPGCRRAIGLDLHHIEYQSHGGGHSLSNLTTLCDLHHRAVHFEKLVICGTAPDQLTFTFRKPRDRRNVTDDDSPFHNTSIDRRFDSSSHRGHCSVQAPE